MDDVLVLLADRRACDRAAEVTAGFGGQRILRRVPAVEIADQADPIGVGRPDREVHAGRRPNSDSVRTELLERPMMRALRQQVHV